MTFAGFVSRHWLPAKQLQLRPTTIVGYERMLRLHILPELGSITLRDLRSETIRSFYGRLLLDGRHDNTGGLSPKTVHEVHAVVRNVLDDAVRRDLLTCNPTYLVAAPRYAPETHDRLDEVADELQKGWRPRWVTNATGLLEFTSILRRWAFFRGSRVTGRR